VDTKLFFNARELAESLGVSVRTLMRLRSSGKLPKPARLGRRLVWRVRDIEQWADRLAEDGRGQA